MMMKTDPYEEREERCLKVEETFFDLFRDPEMIQEAITEGAGGSDALIKYMLSDNNGQKRAHNAGVLFIDAVEEYLWQNAEERVDHPEEFNGV